MAEPEELILEGAHFATRVARDAWRRYGTPAPDDAIPLCAVRARLEMFLTALVRTSITIVPMEPPAPASWLSRLARGPVARPSRQTAAYPAPTDDDVCLPAALPPTTCGLDALTLYRLLAVEQAARARCAGRRWCRLGSKAPRRRTGFCSLKRRRSIAGLRSRSAGWCRAVIAARAHALASCTRAARRRPTARLNGRFTALLAADPLHATVHRGCRWLA